MENEGQIKYKTQLSDFFTYLGSSLGKWLAGLQAGHLIVNELLR